MNIMIEDMNEQMAKDILNWKYDKPYDFYNNDPTDNEEVEELLNGSYYALVNDLNELVGFFCIGESAQVPRGNQYGVYEDDLVDMGLGMNPTLTGKGNGFEFCSFIVNLIEQIYKGTPIRLTVAKFNQRAIHLYEKLGFVKEKEFDTDFAEFITMVKKSNI
ncbi:GNAT family N-acetyltransferase [Paenibacillus sp. FSL K6-2524]|uniref:GNAT family N-acetyltransferase n=1 Tax=Paenibacillus sp. FSL K6-2524 TaxID=2954516 RepID=UPI0030FC99D2